MDGTVNSKLIVLAVLLAACTSLTSSSAIAQSSSTTAQANASSPERDAMREKLRAALASVGARSDVQVSFKQSTKNPYNFIGTMSGLSNSDYLEIVISVTKSNTIGFRIYPHYKGAYINLARAKDGPALMHKLLYYSDQNFLFWGADDGGDVFAGYTMTLESGFPQENIAIVVRSLRNQDKYVGEMRPLIDGSSAS
jgi:hypothetical protein